MSIYYCEKCGEPTNHDNTWMCEKCHPLKTIKAKPLTALEMLKARNARYRKRGISKLGKMLLG